MACKLIKSMRTISLVVEIRKEHGPRKVWLYWSDVNDVYSRYATFTTKGELRTAIEKLWFAFYAENRDIDFNNSQKSD